MLRTIKQIGKAILNRWRYRSSVTGQFLSKEEYDKLPPETTQRERIK